MDIPRIILDTNILVSYMLKPSADMSKLMGSILASGRLLLSQDTFDELQRVIERFVTRGFITIQESSEFLGALVEVADWVKILEHVRVCRDPNDDIFLELAVNAQATFLITGDKDLLALHPFRDTRIITAREYLDMWLT
jgi:uncharacterized protein